VLIAGKSIILKKTSQKGELALKNTDIMPVIDEKPIKIESRNPCLMKCLKA